MTKSLKQVQFNVVIAAILAATGVLCADDAPKRTVDALYPNLASGALTYAQPKALPDGVLLKADGVEIKLSDIEAAIAQQPLQVRAMLQKEMFYVLEQEAAGKLLVQAARKALEAQGQALDAMNDDQLIATLFDQLTKDIEATEQEQRAFYDANPKFFPGTPFDRAQPMIAQHLAREKKQLFVDDYIKTLGQRMTIEVAEAWTKQQALAAKNNPLDNVRQNGKPTIAMFYAASPCCPDTMGPVLSEVRKQFGDKLNVVILNPATEPILAARYAARGNPYLVFFGAEGKEIFRQQGAMSRQQMDDKLAEMGLR